MTKSQDDLMAAFAGESQANRKYLAFAKQAEKDGFKQIAKIFKGAAAAETVHAHNHLKAAGGIKSTKENVKGAIEGEHHEFTNMYPEMIKHAEEEDNKQALRTFKLANDVEKVHEALYKKALAALEADKDMEEQSVYVCSVCGMTVEGDAPDVCPVCKAKKKAFELVE
jgi:rubrerythrin